MNDTSQRVGRQVIPKQNGFNYCFRANHHFDDSSRIEEVT